MPKKIHGWVFGHALATILTRPLEAVVENVSPAKLRSNHLPDRDTPKNTRNIQRCVAENKPEKSD